MLVRSRTVIFASFGLSVSIYLVFDLTPRINFPIIYKYAGSFLEEATKLCFKHKFPDSESVKIPNTIGQRPKTFEIDCLVDSDAIEIKWRDATTDGDHINKEYTRINVISAEGFHANKSNVLLPKQNSGAKNSGNSRKRFTRGLVESITGAIMLGNM